MPNCGQKQPRDNRAFLCHSKTTHMELNMATPVTLHLGADISHVIV
jgi:hypothetical protein